jgi:hypothetical protein
MLKAGQSSSNSSQKSSGKVADGLYGKKGIITSVTQVPDKVMGNYKPDLFIEFKIKSGAYDNTVVLFGHFNRDKQTQKIINWGLASKVDQAFQRLGAYEGLTDAEKELDGIMFNTAVLDNLIGTPVYYLSYVYGKQRNADKPAYRNYGYLLPVDENYTDEEHYDIIYQVLQGDNYTMKQLHDGQSYLRESSERFKASKQPSNVSKAVELTYDSSTSTSVVDDELMF